MNQENKETVELPPEIEAIRDEMVELIGVYKNGAYTHVDAFSQLVSIVLGLQLSMISMKIEINALQEERNV